MPEPADTQATFCATLVDEWARAGLRDAVVAPGSRSTPLALALAAEPGLQLHVFHDERAAAFCALGIGLATGAPAVLLCTSGTAAAHFHAAVLEAGLSGVPLVVCTADRPPELRDVGAPQTVDQVHLYGRAVRWFADPGVPDEAARSAWRSLAARAVLEATGGATGSARPGPVHLNLPFREPLVGAAAALPPGRPGNRPWHVRAGGDDEVVGGAGAARFAGYSGGRCLAVLTSPHVQVPAGWPVLIDARSGHDGPGAVRRADALLRVPALREALAPDVVLHLGPPLASRVVNEWLHGSNAIHHVVADRWLDPAHVATTFASSAATPDVAAGIAPADPAYLDTWRLLDDAADGAIAAVLADHPEPTEPGTARTVLAALAPGAHLLVASSMPVRDLEWFATPRPDVTVHSNRGANGIDGTIASALGIALATGAPTAALLGDLAFLHDSTALVGLLDRGADLTLVVVDNDGGGIFEFLPQANALPRDRFERLYGTPHGVRPEHLAAAHGITSLTVDAAEALPLALEASRAAGGVHLVVVRTDRAANVALHRELHAAVAGAVAPLVP